MKLTFLFLVVGLMQLSASVYSQSTKLSLDMRNAKVAEVLDAIEKQSEFRFAYSPGFIDLNRKVTVDIQNKTVDESLKVVFAGTGVEFSIFDRHILLYPESLSPGTEPVVSHATGAQQRTVSGRVTDSRNQPLPGVTVVVKGTTQGTVTNVDGNYSLANIPENATLVFSFVGMRTQEVFVGNQTNINVRMEEDVIGIEEVVAVGYGTQKKETLVGAVAQVKNEELVVAPSSSTSNTLAGRLPGLVTRQSSGQPGADASYLSIRGFGSPLVIVDGVEADFNAIDAHQIESISMLKDGAASIYGSRASNGVLLITTQRGNLGKPSISINSSYTLQSITDFPQMASSGQRAEMLTEAYLQSGKPPSRAPYTEEEIQKFYDRTDLQYPNTDWYNILIRDNAPMQQHNINVRGGSESIKYYGFLGMMDQESIWKSGHGQKYRRYNLQANMDAQINQNLSVLIDLQSTIESRDYPWRAGDKPMWDDFWDTSPLFPSEYPDKTKISYAGGGGTGGAHITSNSELSGYDKRDNHSIKGTTVFKYDFANIEGLSAKLFFNYSKDYYYTKTLAKPVPYYSYDYNAEKYTKVGTLNALSSLDQSFHQNREITGQFSIEYSQQINNKHNIKALALYEGIDQKYQNFYGGRKNLITTAIDQLFAGDVETSIINGSAYENGRVSYVARINYDYKSKYLFESIFRADASARFPADSRWGYFPSVSFGWRISEENFLKNKSNNFDNLKLRVSYGESGNDNVANFAYLSAYKIGLPVVLDENQINGMVSTGLANPELSWERIKIYNLGFDFSIYDKKLYGEFDMFYRERNGIPATRLTSIPSTFGSPLPPENINSLNDRGFELALGTTGGRQNGFFYAVSGNISYSRAKWDHFEEPDFEDEDQRRIQSRSGRWTDEWFGYLSDGLFTSQEEIDALPFDQDLRGNSTLRIGDIKYIDVNKDGILNWKDQVQIGKGTMPHWFLGFNINLNYKRFDFTSLLQGAFDYYNNVRLFQNLGNKSSVVYDLRWTEENNDKNALIPRLGGASTNFYNSDYYLKPAGYVRLKNMTLGYNIPNEFLEKFGLLNMRIYVAGTNLLTLNKLKKYEIDPEAPSGTTGKYYPQQRTIAAGINIKF